MHSRESIEDFSINFVEGIFALSQNYEMGVCV